MQHWLTNCVKTAEAKINEAREAGKCHFLQLSSEYSDLHACQLMVAPPLDSVNNC